MVRVFENEETLPILGLVSTAVVMPSAMNGEKRKVESVEAYGRHWIVSKLWMGNDGSARANLIPLYSTDEWQQLHEQSFGRKVDDFDQSDEAKDNRQRGGDWCGLVVKCGRRSWVVGPQLDAMHVVYEAEEVRSDDVGYDADVPPDDEDDDFGDDD
jgi:hypothetical protein